MNWDTFRDIMNSFLGVVIIILAFILIPEIKQKRKYWISAIVIGVFMLWLGIDKIIRDNKKDHNYSVNLSLMQAQLNSDSINLDTTKKALKEIKIYLNNLDSIGIKRNPSTNMPIITKLPIQLMPLQDCINLAELFISTTINTQHLTVGVRGCGGEIDIAIITRNNPLEFIQKKKFHSNH